MADYRALLRPFETNFCASQHFSLQQQTTLHHFSPKICPVTSQKYARTSIR